ncbi:ergothioneine biosynthesis glutamate--cysteine ligase EgtA [Sinosporangium siamense]|uniref:Glutamate--cysteine ligase EgtA n=1 Tax=Sinosporangium siamense TaxID=1367973 RepID=A0A919REE7_9ACTN|nr:ergothioneine biosynthesis glutamate--cysteine ligase EgtA [Sinosporangium siamense]GII92353.1 glutamate--cysteine ligase EgtA [Sinosporangium siamense]
MVGLAAEDTPIMDVSAVDDFARSCFPVLTSGGDRVGAELEFLVFDRTAPARPVPVARVAEALPALPGGSRITFEPGGQLELSGPAGDLTAAIGALAADVAVVRAALLADGLLLAGVGLDPVRRAARQVHEPRYDAMAAFLGLPYGALMMCSTASIQVNLDLGEHPARRWERAHTLGPVLTAAFANSPLMAGRRCMWMSGRQAVWENLDRSRTAPVPAAADPAGAWRDYLLDARLMLVRHGPDGYRPVHDGSTFRDWLTGPATVPRPTLDDLAYHATTLFPPVRPRGWLEIRYLDAQHPDLWPVCVAVTHALIVDDTAADTALAGAEPYLSAPPPGTSRWRHAARHGLADTALRGAAEACFDAALAALPRLGAGKGLVERVAEFADRYVTPGLSPAADLMACGPENLIERLSGPGGHPPSLRREEGQS